MKLKKMQENEAGISPDEFQVCHISVSTGIGLGHHHHTA
jgi:hypothetical protein